MITLHVIVSNTTTVKVITEWEVGWKSTKNDYVICEQSLKGYSYKKRERTCYKSVF